jgi:hypothetical protein
LGTNESNSSPNTFFYKAKFKQRATMVLEQAKEIFEIYLSNEENKKNIKVYNFFEDAKNYFEDALFSIKDKE